MTAAIIPSPCIIPAAPGSARSARACPRDDEQRSGRHAFAVLNAVFDSSSLFGIQSLQVRGGHGCRSGSLRRTPPHSLRAGKCSMPTLSWFKRQYKNKNRTETYRRCLKFFTHSSRSPGRRSGTGPARMASLGPHPGLALLGHALTTGALTE